MTTPEPGSEGAAFLAGLRLADSFLPVGSFTASYGIEQYIADDRIDDADSLRSTLAAYLSRVVGPCETIAVAHAHRASAEGDVDRLRTVDERLQAVTLPREFRESSTRAGSGLADLLVSEDHPYADALEAGTVPGNYAVVFGIVAESAGLGALEAALAQGYAFLTGLLGAAQRLGRFGHSEIQAILGELLAELETVCARYVDAPLSSMGAFAPLAEVMGARHERAQRRLFMS